MMDRSKAFRLLLITFFLAPATIGLSGSAAPGPDGTVSTEASGRLITLVDGQSNLVLRLNLEHGCKLDSVRVRGREVLSPNSGVYTGINVSNQWFTTTTLLSSPKLKISSHAVTVSGIRNGGNGIGAEETWEFVVEGDRIEWQIKRHYLTGGCLEDSALPAWEFADMGTWTGGMLDNGGVAWNRYLDSPNSTLGMHAGAVTFWNKDSADALRISAHAGKAQTALRFSHQPARTELAVFSVTDAELIPKHNLRRFLGGAQDLWAPFTVGPGETTVTYTLQALDYAQACDRGQFVGLDGNNIREVLNTIGRYGVIDRHILGANGWRTGFACLHEQWFSQLGIAVADENYIANCAATYDFERDHAIGSDGRVKSRWSYDLGDAMPGTYDPFGFYEAQWGYLMDSQPAFAICIAEQFDLTGDERWLRSHKANCERALDYLLRRDSNHNGLVEMMTGSHSDHRGSDWIDIIWAAHENALVNAEMYYALSRWADLELLLGDPSRAQTFRICASNLKQSFNKTIAEGGFWDPEKNCYAYWRDKDGSIHGNNLVIPVNFAAIGYGVCDDPARRDAILQNIEAQMEKENLFFWPLNFFPYRHSEGHANNFPYPRYENGDIFLSWGELGVRAYAQTEPAVALKYIRNVLAKYNSEGLSFQRYLRRSQSGAGDDILAGNCMTIVGLYRDIYGLQPRHNRLYLEPHLTPELNGTKLKYPLRGKTYTIGLSAASYEVGSGKFAINNADRFGINIASDLLEFFPRKAEQAELKLRSRGDGVVHVRIDSWPEDAAQPRQWTQLSTASPCTIAETVSRLQPGKQYELRLNGKTWRKVRADDSGALQFNRRISTIVEKVELLAVP
jgi:hypothetical protein